MAVAVTGLAAPATGGTVVAWNWDSTDYWGAPRIPDNGSKCPRPGMENATAARDGLGGAWTPGPRSPAAWSGNLPRAVNNLAVQALIAAFAADKAIVDESSARAAVTEVTTE